MENYLIEAAPTSEQRQEMNNMLRALWNWITEKLATVFGPGGDGGSSSAPGGAAQHHNS